MFLDSVRERQELEERERKEREGEELKTFREAVAAKVTVKSSPPVPAAESVSTAAPKTAPAPSKKPPKASLKGVIVKKKPKTAPETKAPRESTNDKKEAHGDDASRDPKRRKVALKS